MAGGKFDIYVYADWQGLGGPVEIGILSAHFAKAKRLSALNITKSG